MSEGGQRCTGGICCTSVSEEQWGSGFCEGYHGVWNCISEMPEFCHRCWRSFFWKRWDIEWVVFLSLLLARSMDEQRFDSLQYVYVELHTTKQSFQFCCNSLFYNTTRFVPPPVFAMLEVSLDFDGFPEMMLQYVTWRLVMLDDIFILW